MNEPSRIVITSKHTLETPIGCTCRDCNSHACDVLADAIETRIREWDAGCYCPPGWQHIQTCPLWRWRDGV